MFYNDSVMRVFQREFKITHALRIWTISAETGRKQHDLHKPRLLILIINTPSPKSTICWCITWLVLQNCTLFIWTHKLNI